MQSFGFSRFFGYNSNNFHSKNKRQRQGRTCRFEELEGREMLSATPWALVEVFDNHGETAQNELQVERYSTQLACNPEVTLRSTSGSFNAPLVSALAPLAAAPPANAHADDLVIYNNLLSRGCLEGNFTWNTAGRIIKIEIGGKGLTGTLDVSALTALEYLYCYNNNLKELDISGCKTLVELWCSQNQLEKLDVSGCSALVGLACDNNQLEKLGVSGCSALVYLYCDNNQLTELDASGCAALTELDCSGNQLDTLKASGCAALQYLHCADNQLNALDVSDSPVLVALACGNNQLEELDVSGCSALVYLYCNNNQLTELDVSDCSALKDLQVDKTVELTSGSVSPNVPTITAQPASASYTQGQAATELAVMANGNGLLTYQWFLIGSATVLATSPTYTPPTATVGTAQYCCVVTNTLSGTSKMVTSTTATITVHPPTMQPDTPVISVQPQSAGHTQGQAATVLSVMATGNGTLTYQWYRVGEETTVLSTSQTYTPPTATVGTMQYYCVVTNTLNGTSKTATSTTATITVHPPTTQPDTPVINVQPQSATYTKVFTAPPLTADLLSVMATGNGVLTYRWYKVGNEATVLATSRTYTPSTAGIGSAKYFCIVTNSLNGTSAIVRSNTVEIKTVRPDGTGVRPVKVSGVKKTNISLSQATISWKHKTKNTFYEVQCTSHPGVTIGEVVLVNGKPTVAVTGLESKTPYKFSIISYNGDTAATKIAKVSVKTKAYTAPKSVKKTVTSNSVMLTWKTSPFPETTRYDVYNAVSGRLLAAIPAPAATGTVSWTYDNEGLGLTPKTTYKFEIVAVSETLDSLKSKVAKVSAKTKKA